MFDRLTSSLVTGAAICAASALAVFAAGFALYAVLLPYLSPAGAAGCVAAAAALLAAIVAWWSKERAERRRLEAEAEQAQLVGALPSEIAGFVADRPLVTLAISLVGGFLAARQPGLIREIISAFRNGR